MAQGVIDGNTHYYVILNGSDVIYDVLLADFVEIVRYKEGDRITLEYLEGQETRQVVGVGD